MMIENNLVVLSLVVPIFHGNYIGLFRTTLSCETICHFNWSSPDTNCGNNQFKKCICRWSA